jgi:hypothetical protein
LDSTFGWATLPQKLSKKELLERWALALEKRKGARLCTLREIEHKSVKERSTLRQESSPLTVAFEDPVLRSAGLATDSAKLRAFLDCRIGSFTTWSVTAISARPWPPRR